jgi:hypothetical protein
VGFVLIKEGMPWPPPGHWGLRTYWQSHRAHWSGDLKALKAYTPATAPGGYWARMAAKPNERQVHVPIAADIARTAADLVAGDTPHIDWEDQQVEATEPVEDEEAPKPKKSPVQETWDAIAQRIGFANKLLEGVETGSAISGWYLKPAWDDRLGKRPLLTVVPADQALPTFLFGELLSVTFVTELAPPANWLQRRESTQVWRWLEHHEPGQIRHELWLGTKERVGNLRPLADHPMTKGFQAVIPTSDIKPGLLVEFVPNDLPNPLDATVPTGRSDLQGLETLLDALDEAMASWMRDIELAKARILVSDEMLTPVSKSGGGFFSGIAGALGKSTTTPAKAFDVDAKVFVPLNMPVEDGDGKPAPIQLIQPLIRFEEHERTVLQLIEQIISRAGYAPQSFGMHVEGQLSGTAMRRRAEKSYRTRDRKRRYLRPALESIAYTLMLLNKVLNPDAPKPDKVPTLVWREADQADPLEMAQVIELLTRARAASREVRVRQAHPEWDDTQVREEVARLAKEDEELNALSPLLGPSEDDHPEDDPSPKPDED